MTEVSIIVPVYKAEKYIAECIDSVINQSFSNWEMILVDDCGGDNSMNIVKDYAQKDTRIHFIESEQNVGPMVAREKGYKTSNGVFVTFLDSDDMLPSYALEILLNKAKDTNADIVSGNIEYLYSDGTRKLWNNSLSHGNDRVSVYRSVLEGEFTHNLCGKLFRGNLLRNYDYSHFENFTNGEDAIFFYEVLDNTNIVDCLTEVVYYYRQNPLSSSQARLSKQKLENVIIANSLNYKKSLQYPDLKKLAYRYFSKCLN